MSRKSKNAHSLAVDRKHLLTVTILESSRPLDLHPLKCLGMKRLRWEWGGPLADFFPYFQERAMNVGEPVVTSAMPLSPRNRVVWEHTRPHTAGAICKALSGVQSSLHLDCLSEPVVRLSPAAGQ